MFSNYLKIAWRSFSNQKYYSLINIVGLALGTAACILILLFVQDELSYEQKFDNNAQIYRLVEDFPMGTHLSRSATVPFPTKKNLMADFPQISQAAFVFRPSSWGNVPILKLEDEEYYEDGFVFAEPEFLAIYEMDFVQGDAATALAGPNQLILTESAARKYFGNENPVGKRLNLNGFVDLEVTGVIRDLPLNTHLQFDMMASFATFRSFFANNPDFFDTQWVWVAAWLYFTVDDETEALAIEEQLPAFVKRHFPEVLAGSGLTLRLQKANDIHLNSNLELEFKENGNIRHVYLFSFIAVLILFIAVINFMNLATSRSAKRAKEVGLRKVMGAHKKMLISQFMGEALMTSFISLVLAVAVIYLLLPWFNELTGKQVRLDMLHNPTLLIGLVLLGLLAGLLAGIYPALILSSFKPTDVLKGNSGSRSSGNLFRKALVVSQFVISISLIICIGIVYKQLHFIQHKALGFDKAQIMLVDMNFNFINPFNGLKAALEESHDIRQVSLLGGSIPGEIEIIENAFVENGKPEAEQQWFSVMFAGHHFEKVLGLEFLQGHSFQEGNAADSAGFIINEAAAVALGWGDDAVGKTLDRLGNGNVIQSGEVIGLVRDFHYRPLYDPIKPLIIGMGGNKMAIKIQSDDLPQAISAIEEKWDEHFEGNPFRYSFMDQNFQQLYNREDKFSKTIQYFSILAIFIACLGLLGLSSYVTEARRKEIGIRKVNGANTVGLVGLLIREFSILVMIAFLISIPVAYYFASLWLDNFAYKTTIGTGIFITAGAISLVVAVLTVSYHTIRAALVNPIDSIRYE